MQGRHLRWRGAAVSPPLSVSDEQPVRFPVDGDAVAMGGCRETINIMYLTHNDM